MNANALFERTSHDHCPRASVPASMRMPLDAKNIARAAAAAHRVMSVHVTVYPFTAMFYVSFYIKRLSFDKPHYFFKPRGTERSVRAYV